VEHEGQPLVRGQRFQDDEQRETDRIGQERSLLRVEPRVHSADDWIRHANVEGLFTPKPT
jgi:hypothetical protein